MMGTPSLAFVSRAGNTMACLPRSRLKSARLGRTVHALATARLGHLKAAVLGYADPDDSLRCVRRRSGPALRFVGAPALGPCSGWLGQSAGKVRRFYRLCMPAMRGARAPRDGHDGYVRRLVVVFLALCVPRRGGNGRCARE